MFGYKCNFLKPFQSIIRNKELLWELVKRDYLSRYKGSALGLLWAVLTPMLMLGMYTFVFGVAFDAKWGTEHDDKLDFAIVIFSGLIVHSLFAECLTRAPSIISAHTNYVKKIVFPLEILPLMVIGSALGNFLLSVFILIIGNLLLGNAPYIEGLLLPILLLPLVLIIVGLSWFLASIGVYLRDFTQFIGLLTTIALFLAPIFYPITALPLAYQRFLFLNPITAPIIQLRDTLLWGAEVNWGAWTISLGVGLIVFYLGYAWFQKTRIGFSDVL